VILAIEIKFWGMLRVDSDKYLREANMTAIKIEGAGYPVKDIFSDSFSFNIPNYQRPYAWTIEQTEKLLDDLLDTMGDVSADINDISPYFLGNIVLIKPDNQTECEVVDGQQRLTTLTILLAVLRKLRRKESLAKYICQPKDEDAGTAARPRLYLRERDREFFKKHIQELHDIERLKTIDLAKLSDSQCNIIQNARVLLNNVSFHYEQSNARHCKQHTDFCIELITSYDYAEATSTWLDFLLATVIRS
jgi:hypothetical protein